MRIGAKPTTTKPDRSPKYTLPVIYNPSTKLVISDSIVIAKYLEKQYPDMTKLFLGESNRLIAAFLDAFQTTVSFNIFWLIVFGTHNVLNKGLFERYMRWYSKIGWRISHLKEKFERDVGWW